MKPERFYRLCLQPTLGSSPGQVSVGDCVGAACAHIGLDRSPLVLSCQLGFLTTTDATVLCPGALVRVWLEDDPIPVSSVPEITLATGDNLHTPYTQRHCWL